ncbi:uncharacterized protein LOC117168088 [Belonocnema kinseyi]|uniref:uncharacterized protein LOC117168088 n=1 Tax=Belonocnema kinseyi TaxID=2817044 RepID=UPI00143D5177|nr:uncharacterized protein LOC117168088 [Belonocnema kinseyi]
MGVTFKAGPIPGIIESVLYNTNAESLPANMKLFLERYCKVEKFIMKVFKRTEVLMYMSEHFTRPLTLLYAMEKIRFRSQESMTIHVVGANNFEEVGQQAWEVLMHWLPNLIFLRVILIGPECATVNTQVTICKICNAKEKKLYVESYGLLYKDYFEGRIFTKPDIVVGFNAGLRIYNTWTDSLLMLTRVKCPFILTTFWEEEIDIDHEIMLKTFGHFARYTYREKNPFASLRPYRDVVNIKVFSRNCGILIYTKLGQNQLETNFTNLLLGNQINDKGIQPLNMKIEQRNTQFSSSVSEEMW